MDGRDIYPAEKRFEKVLTHKLETQRKAAHRARDVRHADEDAHLHRSRGGTGNAHVDHLAELGSLEPGSAEFMSARLVGPGTAPEPIIEQLGPIGPEGFGIIRRVDGITGAEIDTPRIYLPGDA